MLSTRTSNYKHHLHFSLPPISAVTTSTAGRECPDGGNRFSSTQTAHAQHREPTVDIVTMPKSQTLTSFAS